MRRSLARYEDPPKAPKCRLSMCCYLFWLGTGIAVTLVSFVLMMVTMCLPYWYRSKQQHPRIDIGLFRNCSTEGLNRTCHGLNHDFEVVGSYLFGIGSSILMLGTFVLMIALLFSGGRIKRVFTYIFTIFAGPFWVVCVVIYYNDYDNIFEGYQHGICLNMAITTGVLSFVTIIPVWAIYFCAGTNVPCYVRLDVLTIRDVQYAPPAEGEGGPEGPEGAGGAGGPEGAEGAGGPEGAEGAGGPEGPEGAGGDIEDRANMDNVDPENPDIQDAGQDAGEGRSQNIPGSRRLNIQDPGSLQQLLVHIRTWGICCLSLRLSLIINAIIE